MKNKVLIVGTGHHNTLGLVESMGQKGVTTYVILSVKEKTDWVLKSRYIEKGWMAKSDSEILDIMLSNFSDEENKAIVFAASDKLAVLLDGYYDKLCSYFIIPTVREAGTLMKWMEKSKMAELANAVGLQTPQTWLVKNKHIPADITYPCITKALSSVIGTKRDMAICKSELELRTFLNAQDHGDIIQASTFIDKAFEFQFLGCSMGSGKEVLISGRTQIDRPNGIDNTFFLKFDKVEDEFKDTENKVVEFIRKTGYSGPFSVEFLRGKDGVNYFTEMNFRNDGNAICQTAAGINVPFIYYLYCSGGDYLKEIEDSKIKTIWLMPELFYLKFFLQHEFGFKEWWHNMRMANCYTTYFKDDKRPFYSFLLHLIKGFVNKHNGLQS